MKKCHAILLILLLTAVLVYPVGCSPRDPLPETLYTRDLLPSSSDTYTIGSEELPYGNVWGADATFETIQLLGQTVDKAPIEMLAGDLLSVPLPGTIEYDGTGIYLTNTNHRRFISQAADSIIVPVTVSDTVVETTVFTAVLNSDELKTHRVYRTSFFGEISTASASDTLTVRAHINGTELITLTSTAGVATDDALHGWVVFTVRSLGAAGEISTHSYIEIADKIEHLNKSAVAVNTLIINNITLTFEWSAAKVDNIATLDQAFLEVLD